MNTARAVAAAIATTAVVLGTGVAAVAARDDTDVRPRQDQPRAAHREPAAHPLADGTYLGYVRAADLPDATVTVDFVSLEDGRVADEHDELLVYAGGLAAVDLVDRTARPFWIVIEDDAIVELHTADDVLDAPDSTEQKIVGAITDVGDVDGEVSVVLDGNRFDLDADIDVFGADGDRVDVKDWLDAHGSISLDQPLYVEATVDGGVVVSLQNQ